MSVNGLQSSSHCYRQSSLSLSLSPSVSLSVYIERGRQSAKQPATNGLTLSSAFILISEARAGSFARRSLNDTHLLLLLRSLRFAPLQLRVNPLIPRTLITQITVSTLLLPATKITRSHYSNASNEQLHAIYCILSLTP